jgi:hypothetical protein
MSYLDCIGISTHRYPVVERAVAEVAARTLSDHAFTTGIRSSAQRILDKARAKDKDMDKDENVADAAINQAQEAPSLGEHILHLHPIFLLFRTFWNGDPP